MLDADGLRATIDYEPAESTTDMFGGNSNWRGPIWFPLNYLVVNVLERYHRFFGDDFTIEYPTGSGRQQTLSEIADHLRHRLIAIFVPGADGRRPCYGGVERLQTDPAWRDNLLFSEYFRATTAPGWAQPTRRAGPAWSPTSSAGRDGRRALALGDLTRILTERAGADQRTATA